MISIWKKILVVLLVSLLIGGASPAAGWLAVIAAAEPVAGTCGADGNNLTWSLDTETGVLTVSGTGDMADYNDESNTPPWADYKDSIHFAVIESGVTSIGDMAFFLCQSLTDVTIGPDVARIGNQAFTLSGVEEVYVPRSVREIGPVAFGALQFTQSGDVIPIIRRIDVDPANTDYSSIDGVLYNKEQTTLIEYPGGDSLSAFTVPDSVTEIAGMAFAYALYLQDITLPDNLTTIGAMAFNYCAALERISIPGSVRAIGEEVFLGCYSLENVSFEEGITEIPDNLLAQCGNLRTVTLPDSVAVIGAHAFAECENLASLTLGSGVETIGQNAFYGCKSLPGVTIPAGVTEIGTHAFSDCTGLTALTFNAVDCADMNNVFIYSGVQTLVIGNGVRNIPAGAFAGLENVTAVQIPDSTATIGAQAFLSCRNLADLTIGSGVTAIGDAAFQNCEALAQVHIPAAVTSIGAGAFENCRSLAYICSDSSAAYAKTYAEANGIEFRLCSGHGGTGEPNTVSGECGAQGGNVQWELDLDTYALTIRGSGAMADYTSGAVWESYRASISTVAIEDGVTRVGSYDFREFASLTSVTIADSVTEIGTAAFEGCAALASVTLGDGLASIGDRAFKDTGLSSVFLPRSVSQIGADALTCGLNTEGVFTPTLAQIDVAGENEFFSAQDGVLYNKDKIALILYPAANPRASFAIPGSVTAIGGSAFRGCTGLAEVTIPAGVTEIGDYAFAGCTALESFACPDGLTAINEGVFSGCTALENAALCNGVRAIGKQAFEACAALTTIEIPDSVRSIGESAFSACENLTAVAFGTGVGSIGRLAFAGTGLTSVVIPETVMRIEGSTFADCRSLTSIHIPFTVISISESALADCDNLSFICSDTADCYARTYAQTNGIDFRLCTGHENNAVTISGTCGAEGDNVLWALNLGSGRMILSGSGDMADYAGSAAAPWADYLNSIQTVDILTGITSIGDNAFAGCVPLQSVTIGEDVARIGAGAFASSALTSVAVPARVAEIGADAFACGILTEDGFVPTLERIDVEPENAVFFSANGVLFNRSRTVLIQYPAAADGSLYEIPETVKRIESGAFRGSRNLTTVHVPGSVTQIGADAFADCDVLAYLCCDTAGSFAEAYASDNGMDFRYCDGHRLASRVAGDANGDGSVNMKDVILIRRFLAGGWDNVVIYGNPADVDADGSITLQDVTLISRYLAGGWNVVLR